MLKLGEKQGRDLPGVEGERHSTLEVQHCKEVGTVVGADVGCFPCPFFCLWDFCIASTGSLSPCLWQVSGRVCPHSSASRQVCAHVGECCRAAQSGGDGANSFLRLARNRLTA